MQSSQSPRHLPLSARLRRVLVSLCGLILALQLVGSAFHDHDVAEQLSDCVSCHVAAHSSADLPATPPQLLAVFLAIAFILARLPRMAPVARRLYLIPSRQAPPRHQSVC